MGPQHPSTHGVLRLILEIEGETVTEARCGIGYLHTGIEKNLEFRTWTQGTTFVTRMDYLAPLFNETAYCLAVEKLLGITEEIPERATVIRVLLMELNRITSHLVALMAGVLVAGVYGGYFGAAQGVILIGLLSALSTEPLQSLNGLKNVLGLFVNAVGSLVFIITAPDLIDWRLAALVGVGAILGGVLGSRYGRRLPPNALRAVIVVVGVAGLVKFVFFP